MLSAWLDGTEEEKHGYRERERESLSKKVTARQSEATLKKEEEKWKPKKKGEVYVDGGWDVS